MEEVGVSLSHPLTGWDEPHNPVERDCWFMLLMLVIPPKRTNSFHPRFLLLNTSVRTRRPTHRTHGFEPLTTGPQERTLSQKKSTNSASAKRLGGESEVVADWHWHPKMFGSDSKHFIDVDLEIMSIKCSEKVLTVRFISSHFQLLVWGSPRSRRPFIEIPATSFCGKPPDVQEPSNLPCCERTVLLVSSVPFRTLPTRSSLPPKPPRCLTALLVASESSRVPEALKRVQDDRKAKEAKSL